MLTRLSAIPNIDSWNIEAEMLTRLSAIPNIDVAAHWVKYHRKPLLILEYTMPKYVPASKSKKGR